MSTALLYDAQGAPLASPERDPDPETQRWDAWQNWLTGIGTAGDKTTAGRFFPVDRLFDAEIVNLMNGSDLAAKIVEKRPKEMLRRGYDLSIDADDDADDSGEDLEASEIEELRNHATEKLRLEDQLLEAMIWGRAFGGDLLLLGADDGGMPYEPLQEDRIRSFQYLNQIDRRYVYVQTYYNDPLSPKYGLPETYLVANAVAGLRAGPEVSELAKRPEARRQGWAVTVIHETRVIRFDGNPADMITRQQLAGWTWSVLQRVYQTMRGFEHAFDSANYLLSDASQAVFKLRGLIAAIAAGKKQQVMDRVALTEMSRSVLHAVLIDSDANESFERTTTSFAGIPDLLDRWMMRLAAAADMPQTELFGRAPAGLSATGESDTRKWYDTIATEQTNVLSPKIARIFRLMCLADDCPVGKKDLRFQVDWKPLWSPTDKEQSELRLADAQRDHIYLDDGVVTPEEVALDRADLYPSMDLEAREKAMKGAQSFDPYENDPEPTTPALISARGQGQPQGPSAPVPLPGAPQAAGAFGPRNVKRGDAAPATKMQTLIFEKAHFSTVEQVQAWCEKNGKPCGAVRATGQSFRVRQKPPADFKPASFRTIELGPGVKAIIGHPKR